MIIHLNGTEEIKVKDNGNELYNITIKGMDFPQLDGTVQKGSLVLPNAKFDSDNHIDAQEVIAYASESDKVLWTLELEE